MTVVPVERADQGAYAHRRLLDYGERARLLVCADLDEVLGMLAALHEQPLDAVDELVPGATTLLLKLRRPLTTREQRELLTRPVTRSTLVAAGEVRIEVTYDGPDLEDVARLTGLAVEDVIAAHTGQRWTVGFCGFAPGFAYLRGEHDRLRVARRAVPRTRVPAGAVGLADHWSGVYPRRGPGGWQLIGRTDRATWDLGREPPALLHPGTVVRFVPVEGRPTAAEPER
jgi:KipI family sensor histidine kinase inhibitor